MYSPHHLQRLMSASSKLLMVNPSDKSIRIQSAYVTLPAEIKDYYNLTFSCLICQQHSQELDFNIVLISTDNTIPVRDTELLVRLDSNDQTHNDLILKSQSIDSALAEIGYSLPSYTTSLVDNETKYSCCFSLNEKQDSLDTPRNKQCDWVIQGSDKPHSGTVNELKITFTRNPLPGAPTEGTLEQPYITVKALELQVPLSNFFAMSILTIDDRDIELK
jgi:hypothetical protein